MATAHKLQPEPLSAAEQYVLIALARIDDHAYSLALSIPFEAGDRFHPTASGIRFVLTSMAAKGWVELVEGGRQRTYRITGWGRQQLSLELDRLSELVAVGRQRLGPDTDSFANDMIAL